MELKSCPFCGEKMLRGVNGAMFVHPDPDASDCPIRFQEGYTDDDAAAWNRRATAARDAEVEALRAEVVEARDGWHMANGTAELAMKHRGAAEAHAERLAEALRGLLDAVRDIRGVEIEDYCQAEVAAAQAALDPTAAQENDDA